MAKKKGHKGKKPQAPPTAKTAAKPIQPGPNKAKGKTYTTRSEAAQAQKRRKTIVVAVAGVLLVGAIAILPSLLGGDEVGVTDAEAWDLPALDGTVVGPIDGRLKLADYAGTPVVLNFFASWCTACEAELPRFRTAAEFFDGEIEFIFVNANDTGNWRPMAERTGILDQPLMRDINGSNDNGLYRSLGGPGGMPLTAFYDADGNVLQVDPGEMSGDALQSRLQQFYAG
jgi:thiol-disulfide isomerase/thioredoxin